ncbi:MAG TPA: hypothetical protein VGC47_06640 [Acidimicrobiia bacterium]
MIDISTGQCIYCGAERRRDAMRCPHCERMWPDRTVTAIRIDLDDVSEAEQVRAGAGPVPQQPAPKRAARIWVPVGVAVAALGAYLVLFGLILDGGPPDEDAAPQTTLPSQETSPATASPSEPSTTAAPTTAAPTTTVPPTTTATTLAPIEAVGDAIPIDELSLGAFALGPLDIGSPAHDAVGRLVATFGQPDAVIETLDASVGLCDGVAGRLVSWGGLGLVLAGDGEAEAFAGYRLELDADDGPTNGLRTLSGLGLGDTWEQVEAIYPTATGVDIGGAPGFIVSRSSDGITLIWGSLAESGSTALVTGIHSPRPCDGGPTP